MHPSTAISIVLAAILAALTGCSTGTRYARPTLLPEGAIALAAFGPAATPVPAGVESYHLGAGDVLGRDLFLDYVEAVQLKASS